MQGTLGQSVEIHGDLKTHKFDNLSIIKLNELKTKTDYCIKYGT